MRTLVLAAFLLPLLVAPAVSAVSAVWAHRRRHQPVSPATAPGALSHVDLARKDCFGTARNTTSKVWFTIANGVLSDVYYPTIDNTNVETMQYLVTDGATFTIRSRFEPLVGEVDDYRVYVRLDPTINGNGGGGSDNAGADSASIDHSTAHAVPVACDPKTVTNAVTRDYGQPVCSAVDADVPFLQATNGFAGGPSDGLVQLDAAHGLTSLTSDANNGNIVHTGRLDVPDRRCFTLALGFGPRAADAVASAQRSLRRDFQDVEQR
jgi:hypothetical protein